MKHVVHEPHDAIILIIYYDSTCIFTGDSMANGLANFSCMPRSPVCDGEEVVCSCTADCGETIHWWNGDVYFCTATALNFSSNTTIPGSEPPVLLKVLPIAIVPLERSLLYWVSMPVLKWPTTLTLRLDALFHLHLYLEHPWTTSLMVTVPLYVNHPARNGITTLLWMWQTAQVWRNIHCSPIHNYIVLCFKNIVYWNGLSNRSHVLFRPT